MSRLHRELCLGHKWELSRWKGGALHACTAGQGPSVGRGRSELWQGLELSPEGHGAPLNKTDRIRCAFWMGHQVPTGWMERVRLGQGGWSRGAMEEVGCICGEDGACASSTSYI